jgi:hypothetical protein
MGMKKLSASRMARFVSGLLSKDRTRFLPDDSDDKVQCEVPKCGRMMDYGVYLGHLEWHAKETKALGDLKYYKAKLREDLKKLRGPGKRLESMDETATREPMGK